MMRRAVCVGLRPARSFGWTTVARNHSLAPASFSMEPVSFWPQSPLEKTHGIMSGGATAQPASLVERVGNWLLDSGLWLIKRTFQPSLIRRKRKHGFLARSADKDGITILNRRRRKGRRKLCA